MPKKIMVSAGEVSGDKHGAHLVKAIKEIDPKAILFGIGSEALLSQGVNIKFDISRRGTVGIFEALPNIIPVYLAYRKAVQLLKKERPDLLILVDSQGFNIPLAKTAKKLGIKTAYYIAPQEWLWGTKKGVDKISKLLTLIVAIFEEEYKIYKNAGANVVYFGHPLLDIVKSSLSKIEFCKKFNLDPDKKIIAICPGSRIRELKKIAPLLLEATAKISKKHPDAQFLIPVASTQFIREVFKVIDNYQATAIVGQTYNLLNASDLVIATSGTINLEATILEKPNIMVYKLSYFTYLLGKYVLRIKLPFYSMPNLLANKEVIPELTQEKANADEISNIALSLLEKKLGLKEVKSRLGKGGAIKKAAKAILDLIS
jgi:lipid-A-disaccharide synthase